MKCLLETNAGVDFLEFKPSEIAAAVAISVSRELQPKDIDEALTCISMVAKVQWWNLRKEQILYQCFSLEN